jgi:hypothetical protein
MVLELFCSPLWRISFVDITQKTGTSFFAAVAVGGVLEQGCGWVWNIYSTLNHGAMHIFLTTLPIMWRGVFFIHVGTSWHCMGSPYHARTPLSHWGFHSVRQYAFIALLAAYLTADIAMTVACFDRKVERDAGIPPSNRFEVWVDEHYTDQFIARRFENLVIDTDHNGAR